MEEKLSLKIVTKEKKIIDEKVDAVFIPAQTGEIGILPGHRALIALLGIGILRFLKGEQNYFFGISEGIAEILNDNVNVLVDEVILEEEINEEEEREKILKAEELLKTVSGEEQEKVQKEIKKAIASLFLLKNKKIS